RPPSETIKQSAEPAESVASGLAGHQAGSARSSHRSPGPSIDILVAIHSCRDQNKSHQNKEDPRPPQRIERSFGLISLFGSVCLSLDSFPSVLSLQYHQHLPSETIKQSAEPAESIASGLAGHQAGSARSSHRSPVQSIDILVAIHSCRDQNQSHQNKEDPRPPLRLERSSGLISLFGSVCLSLGSFPSVLSLQYHQYTI
ncbi:hypothetical protein HID58_091626, partial [Brassica napus]